MKACVVCLKNEAISDPIFGLLPCSTCQARQAALKPANDIPEMVGENIKEQRKQHFSDIHPAHRKGVASREFLERWGKNAMKRQGFSDNEIKNAKYVWNDDSYYKNGN